jgi:hypothetical protein
MTAYTCARERPTMLGIRTGACDDDASAGDVERTSEIASRLITVKSDNGPKNVRRNVALRYPPSARTMVSFQTFLGQR